MSLRVLPGLVLVGMTAGTARAQPHTTENQRREAGELVKKAIARSQAGDHAQAIELYLHAYEIAPLPILLSNIGAEYQAEGKPAEALDSFCKYLAQDPDGTNVSYARDQAKALQAQLGHPVGDDDVCTPAPPPPPATAPVATPAPTVTATAGELHAAPAPPARPGRTLRLAGLGVGIAGVAAFGVGVGYGIRAKQISDDISSHDINKPWRNDITAYEQKGKDDQTRQILFMVAGGVVALAGGALYYLGHQRGEHAEHVAIVPTGSPTSFGLAVSGGF